MGSILEPAGRAMNRSSIYAWHPFYRAKSNKIVQDVTPSGAILFAYKSFIEKWIRKWITTTEAHWNESGLTQLI